jgi:hypothetical protein
VQNRTHFFCLLLENGHDGTPATGFRSLKEPFDHPAFVTALGEAFAAASVDREQIGKGEFTVTLGQVAFAAYKVTQVCQ